MTTTSYHTEAILIADLHEGNNDAFTHIYNQYKQPVFFFAKRFIIDISDAEDLAADAFVKLWQRRTSFDSLDAIGAFLYTTVRHSCYNFLRHASVIATHQKAILLDQQSTDEPFIIENARIELLTLIYEKVNELPPKMRDIFLLSYKEGLKPAEIAERLQLSVQTVKNQRVTAIRLLREALRHYPAAMAVLLRLLSQH